MLYDKALQFIKNNDDINICQPFENGGNIILMYISYLYLKNIDTTSQDSISDYFNNKFIDYEKGDIVSNILYSDYSTDDKKKFIEFYYNGMDILKKIERENIKIPKNFQLYEDTIVELFDAKEFIKSSTSIKFDRKMPIYIYVSALSDEISYSIIENIGVFCSVTYLYGKSLYNGDESIELLGKEVFDDKEVINTFKALGDETRYNIIKLIYENEDINMTEIAEKLNLTLPTISHHISLLGSSQLILPDSYSKNNKNKIFTINKLKITDLIEELEIFLK